jgi:hypothetical protein
MAELVGHETEHAGGAVADDAELDAIEIRAARLPVVRVLGELDGPVRFEGDELEGAGADRLGAHVLGRDVAGVDRRQAGGQQRRERGLRTAEHEGRLQVAGGGHLFKVAPPDPAGIVAELVGVLACELVPGALHVLGRERLAVVPLDAAAQLEGQFSA